MKNFILLLVVAVLALPALAEQLTADQSLARFASMNGRAHHVKSLNKSGLRLVHTAKQKSNNLYYVFDRTDEGGFLILGADDLVPELIGYTNAGRFDSDHVAPALKWWLSECEKSISAAIATGKKLVATTEGFGGDEIAPLVKSQWSQSGKQGSMNLFNKYCPTINNQLTPVGCMATAMAQIMRYHQWPVKGAGQVKYTTNTHKVNLSEDLSKTTYQWNQMLDKYGYVYNEDGTTTNYSCTEAQNDAVSKLSYHCGLATEMDYAPGGSGTGVPQALTALVTNFGYSPTMYMTNRDLYSEEDWVNLIYSELEAERPVLYTGYTKNEEGHAFIVDGFKDGLFHLNWGWGGLSDGYYTVFGNDALHPLKQGTGGSAVSDAFAYGHYVIINFAKPADITTTAYHFASEGTYTVANYSSPNQNFCNGDIALVSFPFAFFNYGGAKVKVRLGLRLTNTETKAVRYLQDAYQEPLEFKSFSGAEAYHVACEDLPEGVYDAVPVVKVEGTDEWTDILMSPGVPVQKMAFGDAEVPEEGKDDAQLFCSKIEPKDEGNNERTINVVLKTPGNVGQEQFRGYVTLALYDEKDEFVALLEESKVNYSMAAFTLGSENLSVSATVPASVADGHYYVYPCAFQIGSEHWCTFFAFDTTTYQVSYDPVEPLPIWISGNTVAYKDITTGVERISENDIENNNIYDLQGRITTRQKQNSHIYIIRNKENSQKVW